MSCRRVLLCCAPLLMLAGCATPAQRIAAKLGEHGVPPRQARCMGERLEQRLSYSQLRRLDQLARVNGDRIGRMSITDIARTFGAPQDASLAAEIVRAGIGCVF